MNHFPLPEDLPVPQDDGSASHLTGLNFPSGSLIATTGKEIDISKEKGLVVIYVYPRTGKPGQPLPEGWNEIPGARGCTPQSCSFKNLFLQYQKVGAQIYGLSSQETDYQREVKERLQLPFEIISDSQLKLKNIISLPTFITSQMELYKRVTLVIKDGKIIKYFYPVFPPDKNAEEVLTWIINNPL